MLTVNEQLPSIYDEARRRLRRKIQELGHQFSLRHITSEEPVLSEQLKYYKAMLERLTDDFTGTTPDEVAYRTLLRKPYDKGSIADEDVVNCLTLMHVSS